MFRWSLVITFAIALGHLGWVACARTPMQDYWVEGDGSVLCSPDQGEHQLYLRRELFLSQQPRRAWLQVIGRDRIKVYVNGKFLGSESLLGGTVGIVNDLTPHLKPGCNVIAIAVSQNTFAAPPAVAVSGAYAYDKEEFRIAADNQWRCRSVFERKAHWWFEPGFSDRHWSQAVIAQGQLSARVVDPPRATTEPNKGKWITPIGVQQGHAVVRREFNIAAQPRQAWLRVTATSSYRLVVNGVQVDQQEEQVATKVPTPSIQRTYDISPVVRQGHNVIALMLTATAGEMPRVLGDVEVEDIAGQLYHFGTDESWLSQPGLPADWFAESVAQLPENWHPASVQSGDLLTPAWLVPRQTVALVLPWSFTLSGLVAEMAWICAIALVAWLACLLAEFLLANWMPPGMNGIVSLAFLPATLTMCAAMLATWDPRVPSQSVYRSVWVSLAAGSVLVQWVLLALLSCWKRPLSTKYLVPSTVPSFLWRWAPTVGLLAILLLAGSWLRLRNIATEGLMWDEVENYHATLGFLERGFPSLKVHDDLPPMYIHTSELQFIPMGIVALLTNDPAWIVRFPAVFWSLLTLVTIYYVGRKLFSPSVGMLAAAIYTFAPLCIAVSNFGRYFSQLQFLALLTVYFFWLTVSGTGPLNRRALWLTAGCFIAMFLTWEASALLALGMIPAALMQRHKDLRSIFYAPAVWTAMLVVLLAVVAQQSHMILQHTKFMWWGVSLSDTRLIPVWRFPAPSVFRPWFYIYQSSWNHDALLPLLGLLGAMALAVRHAWRGPVRFVLVVYLGGCLSMSFLMPNPQWRFTQHLIPLFLLLSSAALVAGLHQLVALAARVGKKAAAESQPVSGGQPAGWTLYARCMAVAIAVGVGAIASGAVVELREMIRLRVEGHSIGGYRFPNLAAGARYVQQHIKEGDVLMANNVFQIHHGMGIDSRPNRPLDFSPTTASFLPATLDDHRSVVLDRRDGVQMLADPASIVDLFARHERIWYVVKPGQHCNFNTPEVSSFLRQHMEVVFEDWDTIVLFRNGHRPAELRVENEKNLDKAQARFLP